MWIQFLSLSVPLTITTLNACTNTTRWGAYVSLALSRCTGWLVWWRAVAQRRTCPTLVFIWEDGYVYDSTAENL